MKQYHCHLCGEPIPESTVKQIISDYILERNTKGGRVVTEKKLAAQRSNMSKLNAAYTPEKRAAAQAKRIETMRRKKLDRQNLTENKTGD